MWAEVKTEAQGRCHADLDEHRPLIADARLQQLRQQPQHRAPACEGLVTVRGPTGEHGAKGPHHAGPELGILLVQHRAHLPIEPPAVVLDSGMSESLPANEQPAKCPTMMGKTRRPALMT